MFLNGSIQEEVDVDQPLDFINPTFLNHVFKLKRLSTARGGTLGWYDCLRKFILENNFQIWKVDTNLFTKKFEHNILLVQINVDDMIFSTTNEYLCKDFSEMI